MRGRENKFLMIFTTILVAIEFMDLVFYNISDCQ